MHASRTVLAIATLIAGAIVGVGADRLVFAQPGGIKRTILLRADEPGASSYEAVMGIAEIPAGARAGKHRHPGIEIAYVLEGTVLLEHEGQAARTVKAGEAFKNDGVHDAKNTGTRPAKILAVYLVEKGKPMAETVP